MTVDEALKILDQGTYIRVNRFNRVLNKVERVTLPLTERAKMNRMYTQEELDAIVKESIQNALTKERLDIIKMISDLAPLGADWVASTIKARKNLKDA